MSVYPYPVFLAPFVKQVASTDSVSAPFLRTRRLHGVISGLFHSIDLHSMPHC